MSKRNIAKSRPRNVKKKNIFAGADDVYLTKNFIAVKNVSTFKNKLSEKTIYVPKTKSNIDLARKTFGGIRKNY